MEARITRTTLTMKEAAEYLGISYWLLNQLVRRRQIPCSKVGGKFLFRVQVLEEYLRSVGDAHEPTPARFSSNRPRG